MHLQTHCCNHIKAFGLWEFQTHITFSLHHYQASETESPVEAVIILPAPQKHRRHVGAGCVGTEFLDTLLSGHSLGSVKLANGFIYCPL